MIVAIDASPAVRRRLTGTEVYARAIIVALASTNRGHAIRLYANAALPPPWLPAGVEWRGIPFPRLWTHLRFARALRRDRPSVAFVPSHVLPFFLSVPGVATIHDVGHRHEPQAYRRADRWYLELTTRYMARRAARLIADSETTAADLRRFYGVPPSRITVVYPGVAAGMEPPLAGDVDRVRRAYGLPRRYFLYVGRAHPRKNLPMLLRAFAAARGRGLQSSLVLAGPGHAVPASDSVHVLGYVPAEDLPALYAGALALTLPSRFEGFGFPALEAMRCGTAVLASSAGALPEVIGDAGILLSRDDAAAWTDALLRLSEDAALQGRLIAAGQAWSARFTWDAAAVKVWQVLRQAAAVASR